MNLSRLAPPLVSRWPYLWQGTLLVVLKYNLDRLIAWGGFGRPWYAWDYAAPGRWAEGVGVQGGNAQTFYLILLLTSLPFLGIGLWLTLGRLRSAGLSPALCLLFFVPVVNVLFFLVLGFVPEVSEREALKNGEGKEVPAGFADPGSRTAAIGSILFVGLAGGILAIFSVKGLNDYGWGLFVALPFALGMTATLLYGHRRPRTFRSAMVVAMMPVVVLGVLLFAVAFEGIVCLLMAAPIAGVLAFVGGLVGHSIQEARHAAAGRNLAALLLLALPLLMGMESRANLETPLLRIVSSVDIDAPPERVWPNVVAFSAIPDRREWLFHTGIAYPTHAVIEGQGVGAVRHCVFSTGEFIEPVEAWDPPRLLAFSVAAQPEPLEELTPYPAIHPPHLHGYMVSKHGQLRLVPLDGGTRTRLEGTTWYTNRIWPVAYWQVWSDFIVHRIHLRVLNHIKAVSEGAADR